MGETQTEKQFPELRQQEFLRLQPLLSNYEATAKVLGSCLVAAHGVHASCSPCRLLRHPDLGNDHVAHEEGLSHAGGILQGASHHLCAAISSHSPAFQQLALLVQARGRKEKVESHVGAQ